MSVRGLAKGDNQLGPLIYIPSTGKSLINMLLVHWYELVYVYKHIYKKVDIIKLRL